MRAENFGGGCLAPVELEARGRTRIASEDPHLINRQRDLTSPFERPIKLIITLKPSYYRIERWWLHIYDLIIFLSLSPTVTKDSHGIIQQRGPVIRAGSSPIKQNQVIMLVASAETYRCLLLFLYCLPINRPTLDSLYLCAHLFTPKLNTPASN